MSLKDQITEDMKAAMRAKDSERLGTIRLLTAAMKQKEVDERMELDDVAVIAIVDKMLKQRKDSIDAFEKANRQDLADKEIAESEGAAGLPARAPVGRRSGRRSQSHRARTRRVRPRRHGQSHGRRQSPSWPARPTWAWSAAAVKAADSWRDRTLRSTLSGECGPDRISCQPVSCG
jgi:hypothetical protein